MSDSKTVYTYNGMSGTTLLGVLFIGLKLTGYIDWSWWWVTLPFWGPPAIVLAVLAVIGVSALAALVFAWVADALGK
jgi:hypothetical protein